MSIAFALKNGVNLSKYFIHVVEVAFSLALN